MNNEFFQKFFFVFKKQNSPENYISHNKSQETGAGFGKKKGSKEECRHNYRN